MTSFKCKFANFHEFLDRSELVFLAFYEQKKPSCKQKICNVRSFGIRETMWWADIYSGTRQSFIWQKNIISWDYSVLFCFYSVVSKKKNCTNLIRNFIKFFDQFSCMYVFVIEISHMWTLIKTTIRLGTRLNT